MDHLHRVHIVFDCFFKYGTTYICVYEETVLSLSNGVTYQFLPALILTGFLFDPHSQPVVIQYISRLLPPTYF